MLDVIVVCACVLGLAVLIAEVKDAAHKGRE